MSPLNQQTAKATHRHGSAVIDVLAIGIALTLSALNRFNVIPHIGF